MAGMRVLTELTKGSEFSWMTDTWVWQDDAACAFSPPTMFEVAFEGDPIAEGLSVNEIKDLNSANIEAAKKVCSSCPVWHLCYQSAEPGDFHETVRAGVTPLRHNSRPIGRPSKGARVIPVKKVRALIDPTKPCKNGHMDWRPRSDQTKSFYCIACKRNNTRRRTDQIRTRIDPTKPCKNGHPVSNWAQRSDNKGFLCKACKSEAGKAARGVKKTPRKTPEERSTHCVRGHEDWYFSPSGSRHCRQCKRDREGTQKRKPLSPDDKCGKGHCDWGVEKNRKGRRYCRACRAERARFIRSGGKLTA